VSETLRTIVRTYHGKWAPLNGIGNKGPPRPPPSAPRSTLQHNNEDERRSDD